MSERSVGFAKSGLPRGAEDAGGVGKVLDDRIEARRRPFHGPAGEQLVADRADLAPEIAELVLREIERRRWLAAPQSRQAAAQHVNRPQQPLREEQRHQRRTCQHVKRGLEDRLQLALELGANEQRRDADANGAKVHVAEPQRLPHLERASLTAEDLAELAEVVARDEIVEPRRLGQRACR